MIPRPKSFGSKLLALFVLVVAAAQFVTWFIVAQENEAQAERLIGQDLQRAAGAFNRVVAERNALLAAGAATAARAFEFKQLFAEELDSVTLASALESPRLTTDSNFVAALSPQARILAVTPPATVAGDILAQLVARAEADESPDPRATGYAYIDGKLHSLVVAPVRAPDIIAWLAIGFLIDGDFAERLKKQTGVDLTFAEADGRVLATTLSDPAQALTIGAALPTLGRTTGVTKLPVQGETALIKTQRLSAGSGGSATLGLQYSLEEKMRPARATELLLLYVATGSLVLAGIVSRIFAHRLSRPIIELVGQTRRIAGGNYSVEHRNYRHDELGRLAQAFDQMSNGLAERDRVRDLLDKNVSPEVAAQLLRDGAALGGQERPVTILFADLRGFTTMSEKLTAPELVTLLNRYLDRMSTEIERQGGIIDKFIGDAIMALFGAPLDQADAADRAIAAALAMERALVTLNAELAQEGRSALGVGIGINSANVVAGNIGSHRRLNYSVIGDGVNVASRLQSLTRTAEYQTNLIVSAATLDAVCDATKFSRRHLGVVPVKGRAEPVEIFAVEAIVNGPPQSAPMG